MEIFQLIKANDSAGIQKLLTGPSGSQHLLHTNEAGFRALDSACVLGALPSLRILLDAHMKANYVNQPEFSRLIVLAAYLDNPVVLSELVRYCPLHGIPDALSQLQHDFPSEVDSVCGRLLQEYVNSLAPHSNFSLNLLLQLPVEVVADGTDRISRYLNELKAMSYSFLLGSHDRVGHASPVRALPRDILELVVRNIFPSAPRQVSPIHNKVR
eukprot:c9868_g5_i1.p1 GENE.c9868_g5_i1~~c9868_g5_i1.p1  ORF type:complete len:233 (-),score=49.07 c9868_g5_i1:129-767(-)